MFVISPIVAIFICSIAAVFGVISYAKNKYLIRPVLILLYLLLASQYFQLLLTLKISPELSSYYAKALAAHLFLVPFYCLKSGSEFVKHPFRFEKLWLSLSGSGILLILFTDLIVRGVYSHFSGYILRAGAYHWVWIVFTLLAIVQGGTILWQKLQQSEAGLHRSYLKFLSFVVSVFALIALEFTLHYPGFLPGLGLNYFPLTGANIVFSQMLFLYSHYFYKTNLLEVKNRELELSKENELRLALLEKDEALLRMKHLYTQLDPHFIFNSLNGIKQVVTQDVKRGREMITKMGSLLRWLLSLKDGDILAIGEEVKAVKNYLDMEKFRMDNYLLIKYDIDESLMDVKVPIFLIQPLIENAMKYGQITSKDRLEIFLGISRHDQGLKITVSNSGNWVDPSEKISSGMGIGRLKSRLKNLYLDSFKFNTLIRPGNVIQELILEKALV